MKLFASKRRWLVVFAAVAIVYVMLAYIMLPLLWTHHEHGPGLASLPMVTRTSAGIPGDALNVRMPPLKSGFVNRRSGLQSSQPAPRN